MEIFQPLHDVFLKLDENEAVKCALEEFLTPNTSCEENFDLSNLRFLAGIQTPFTEPVIAVLGNLEAAATAGIAVDYSELPEDQFLKILWFATHESEEYHNGPMESLHLLLLYASSREDTLMSTNQLCKRLYVTCLNKLTSGDPHQTVLKLSLIKQLNTFIDKTEIPMDPIVATFKFCYMYSSIHKSSFQYLHVDVDNEDPPYFAFVCVYNIVTRNYAGSEEYNKRLKVIVAFLAIFEESLTQTDCMSPEQHIILCTNVKQLLRLICPFVCNDADKIVVTNLLNITDHLKSSKIYALLLAQLPFDLFENFVSAVTNLMNDKYVADLQEVCYNLLDTPIVDMACLSEKTSAQQLVTLKRLILVVMKPIRTRNNKCILNTLSLTDQLLRTSEDKIRDALLEIFNSGVGLSSKLILDYVYMECDILWLATEKKTANQYFISMFCNLYVICGTISVHSFTRLQLVLEKCDILNLKPCLPVILRVLKVHLMTNEAITKCLASKIIDFAICAGPNHVDYVNGFHHLFFEGLDEDGYSNIKIMTYFASFLNMRCLLRKMVSDKIISVSVVEANLAALLSNHSWEIIRVVITEMNMTVLPPSFMAFWDEHVNLEYFMGTVQAIGFLNTFNTFLDMKSSICQAELKFIKKVYEFTREQIINRAFPVVVLPFVVTLLYKVTMFLGVNVLWLKLLATNIEQRFQMQLAEVKMTHGCCFTPQILLRDILYLGHILFVFGNKNYVAPLNTTLLELSDAIPLLKINLDYDEYTDAILKCSTQICIRRPMLAKVVVPKLDEVVRMGTVLMRASALTCLFEIAQSLTKEFDEVLAYIFEFMASKAIILKVAGTSLLVKLFEQHYLQLCPWQAYSDLANFSLDASDITKIAKHPVSSTDKKIVYGYLLRNLSKNYQFNIVNQLATQILGKFFNDLKPEKDNLEMLHDITYIATIVFKRLTHQMEYPRDLVVYETTVVRVENELLAFTMDPRAVIFEEYEPAIKTTLNALFKIMYKLGEDPAVLVFPELLHSILAITHYLFDQIFNILFEDGSMSSLRTHYQKLRGFFDLRRSLFCGGKPERDLEMPSIDWASLYEIGSAQ